MADDSQIGDTEADQPMKSSLLDDEDVNMQGTTGNEEQEAARDYEAAQIKQMSSGQTYENNDTLMSSQNKPQATGSNAPIEIRKKQEDGLQESEENNDGILKTDGKKVEDSVKSERD